MGKRLEKQRGFTLTELVIVIAIVAILVSLAVPGYRDFVYRTKRMEAINTVIELAACQERIYTQTRRYGVSGCGLTAGCIDSADQRYKVCFGTGRPGANGPADQSFVVTATPQGPQAGDRCGDISLDDVGARGASRANDAADVARCWQGGAI